jgi:hypothetical protein
MARGGQRYGAGRRREHERAEEFRSIDVRRFSQAGMLRPGHWTWSWRDPDTRETLAWISVDCGEDAIRLRYNVNGKPFDTRVGIERTTCGFGGSRAWFGCPRCGARVAILYGGISGFACRRCHDLVYSVQSATDMAAAWQRSRKLGDRLGPNWSRPKGMHHATCGRLQERAYRAMLALSSVTTESTDRLVARLEGLGLA